MLSLLAQINNPAVGNRIGNVGNGTAVISGILSTLITSLLVIGIVAFMFYFLWGALRWIMSQGDKGKVQEARLQITHAIAGLVVMFSVYLIAAVIQRLFCVNLLSPRLPVPGGNPIAACSSTDPRDRPDGGDTNPDPGRTN